MRLAAVAVFVLAALAAGCQQQEPGTSELAAQVAETRAELTRTQGQLADVQKAAEALVDHAVENRGYC
jgi:uncharacterized coiled-coil protein SlyX